MNGNSALAKVPFEAENISSHFVRESVEWYNPEVEYEYEYEHEHRFAGHE